MVSLPNPFSRDSSEEEQDYDPSEEGEEIMNYPPLLGEGAADRNSHHPLSQSSQDARPRFEDDVHDLLDEGAEGGRSWDTEGTFPVTEMQRIKDKTKKLRSSPGEQGIFRKDEEDKKDDGFNNNVSSYGSARRRPQQRSWSREWSIDAASRASGASVTTYSQSRTEGDSEILYLLDLSTVCFHVSLYFPCSTYHISVPESMH
jgi:hypothetical protein